MRTNRITWVGWVCEEEALPMPAPRLARSYLVRTNSFEEKPLRCREAAPAPPIFPRPFAPPAPSLFASLPPPGMLLPFFSVEEACDMDAALSSKDDSSNIKSVAIVAAPVPVPPIGGREEHTDRVSSKSQNVASSADGETANCCRSGGVGDEDSEDDDALTPCFLWSSSTMEAGKPPVPSRTARTSPPRPC